MKITQKIAYNKLKICFTLGLILLITACNTAYKQASALYAQGNYFSAVYEITKDLDKSQKMPSDKMIVVVKDSIKRIEESIAQTPDTYYVKKIDDYEKLYQISLLLNGKAYTKYFAAFHIMHPIEQLKNTLVELYYQQGNSITGTTVIHYKERADIYNKGLQYGEYKDMRILADDNAKTYATLAAELYYGFAEVAIKNGDYKDACRHLIEAVKVYRPYGIYKDSVVLFNKYDPIWRKQEAEVYFNQAQQLASNTRYRSVHREAAELYKKAYDVYSSYGDYRDSKTLAEQEKSKGTIVIYYDGPNGESYTFDRIANTAVKDYFSDKAFRFSSSRGSEDVFIKIAYSVDVRDTDTIPSVKLLKYNDQIFKEITSFQQRVYTIKGIVSYGGGIDGERRVKASSYSAITCVNYEGNVPYSYRNQCESHNIRYNQLKSKSDLAEDVEGIFKEKLEGILTSIRWKALNKL